MFSLAIFMYKVFQEPFLQYSGNNIHYVQNLPKLKTEGVVSTPTRNSCKMSAMTPIYNFFIYHHK